MKVLNFGSMNLDYVYEVPHFVQPGETVPCLSRSIFAGGKGLNQSVALSRAGVTVFHAGSIGEGGELLLAALQEAGVNCDFICRQNAPSGHTVIQIDPSGQNCILYFGGTNRMILKQHIEKTLSSFDKGDILLLQNEINDLDNIIETAHLKGLQIVLNPSPIDDAIRLLPLEKIDYFIVNELEGMQISGAKHVKDILPAFAQKYPNAKILLTLGADGARYFDGNDFFYQEAQKVKVVDTTAAGDTFLGYFIAGIVGHMSVRDTLLLASKAAAITVSSKGAAQSIPTIDRVV